MGEIKNYYIPFGAKTGCSGCLQASSNPLIASKSSYIPIPITK